MSKTRIGVIGGSGLYEMDGLTDREEVNVSTPFGDPSDVFILGTLEGRQVCFLSRHGRGHRYSPSEVPFQANVYGMKSLGERGGEPARGYRAAACRYPEPVF